MGYNRHQKTHDRPYDCKLCDRKFGLRHDLDRHKIRHEKDKRRFKCKWPMCSYKGTTRKEYLLRHMRKAHVPGSNDQAVLPEITRLLGDSSMAAIEYSESETLRLKFLEAVASEDPDGLQQLLLQCPDINLLETDDKGRTAIDIAFDRGDKRTIKVLVNFGMKIDPQLVMRAVRSRDLTMVEHLEKLGADPNLPINTVTTWDPLCYAIENNDSKMVELLTKFGAAANFEDTKGRTPLLCAIAKRNLGMVQYLLQLGADPNSKNSSGQTPLFRAIENRESTIMECLLEFGADPHSRDSNGRTTLHYAARRGGLTFMDHFCGDPTIINHLLKLGVDPNLVDSSGQTPLYSAMEDSPWMVDDLLRNGADLNWRDSTDRTPFFML